MRHKILREALQHALTALGQPSDFVPKRSPRLRSLHAELARMMALEAELRVSWIDCTTQDEAQWRETAEHVVVSALAEIEELSLGARAWAVSVSFLQRS